MKKRTSRGHLSLLTQRLKKVRTYSAWKVLIESAEFVDAMATLVPAHRVVAQRCMAEAYERCNAAAPIPPMMNDWTKRVVWDEARIAQIKALDAKFGDDDVIARYMGLPIKAVRPARWRYCGPRRPGAGGRPRKTPSPSIGSSAT